MCDTRLIEPGKEMIPSDLLMITSFTSKYYTEDVHQDKHYKKKTDSPT